MNYHRRGFTIIELLVVIVAIGILSSIGIALYNGHIMRSKANVIIADLSQIEETLQLYVDKSQRTTWPDQTTVVNGNTLQQVIDGIGLKPITLLSTPIAWEYDYDGDSKGNCNNNGAGTNIIVVNISQELTRTIDSTIDDGDINCGKVRYSDAGETKLYYTLSNSNTIN